MEISKKQNELDEIKWYIGQEIGGDPCGTFAYCIHCRKDELNPCENALRRYKEKSVKTNAKKGKKKINGLEFRATILENKKG